MPCHAGQAGVSHGTLPACLGVAPTGPTAQVATCDTTQTRAGWLASARLSPPPEPHEATFRATVR